MISRLVKVCSSQNVSINSCTLRRKVRALVRNRFLATCCVNVEPPCTNRPDRRLTSSARAIPSTSTPGWVQNDGPRSRPPPPASRRAGPPGAAESPTTSPKVAKLRPARSSRVKPGRRAASSAASGARQIARKTRPASHRRRVRPRSPRSAAAARFASQAAGVAALRRPVDARSSGSWWAPGPCGHYARAHAGNASGRSAIARGQHEAHQPGRDGGQAEPTHQIGTAAPSSATSPSRAKPPPRPASRPRRRCDRRPWWHCGHGETPSWRHSRRSAPRARC